MLTAERFGSGTKRTSKLKVSVISVFNTFKFRNMSGIPFLTN